MAPAPSESWSPAVADIIGARLAWTVTMISSVSKPWMVRGAADAARPSSHARQSGGAPEFNADCGT